MDEGIKMNERYSRQESVVSEDKLKDAKVLICGLGAVGSTIADLLARIGVGIVYLLEYDTVELHNIAGQRFKEEDVGKPKANVMETELKKINSEITVFGMNMKLTKEDQLPKDLDYVFSCVDNYTARKIMSDYQKRINKKVIILDGGLNTATTGTNQMYIKGKNKITDFYPKLNEKLQQEQRTTCTGELIPSLVTTTTVLGALRVHQFLQHLMDGREYLDLMNVALGRKISVDYFSKGGI